MSLSETLKIYRKMHQKSVNRGDLDRVVKETDDITGTITARLFRDKDNSDDHSQALTALAAASIVEAEIMKKMGKKS